MPRTAPRPRTARPPTAISRPSSPCDPSGDGARPPGPVTRPFPLFGSPRARPASWAGWSRYSEQVNFDRGAGWPDWKRDYRYGALVIEPPEELAAVLDPIREQFDPASAQQVGAHITVTPPFLRAPTAADEARVASCIRRVPSMRLQLGNPRRFDGSSVVYLPVANAGAIIALREVLLATGLFRLDLLHTSDFIPHLTISEFGTLPEAALLTVIPAQGTRPFDAEAITWLVPNEQFRFAARRTFALGAAEQGRRS